MAPPKTVDTKLIAMHGCEVEKQVVEKLNAVKQKLGGDGVFDLEGGDFSITMSMMAVGYPIALQFFAGAIDSEATEAAEMARRLDRTAVYYRRAEEANTAR
ncbi:hypothetical protein [Actinomadura flavalba]|uniref:hypothetical protein n=1 Tax=Actinomadura flavalba TaxID=1120938 RepID=UPI0003820535|nr:hypothetical protein [Actinomadura flavalba]